MAYEPDILRKRTRLQTNATTGLATWTFATPYPAGVIPVVLTTVEVGASETGFTMIDIVGAPTNTSVTFRTRRGTGVIASLLNVLGLPVPVQAYVHATAALPAVTGGG